MFSVIFLFFFSALGVYLVSYGVELDVRKNEEISLAGAVGQGMSKCRGKSNEGREGDEDDGSWAAARK